MITGNGLIAQAFKGSANDDRVHVFASGVSRSNERDPAVFGRERNLLEAQPTGPGRFIYFSSCSIHDPSLRTSPYVAHKQQMEALVRNRFTDHLIIRLPNLVGHTSNPYTLTNFLRDRIIHGQPFDLHMQACRYLLDVDDVAKDLPLFFRMPALKGATLEVCGSVAFPIPEVVRAMEQVLEKSTEVLPVATGSCYTVDNTRFLDLLPEERRNAYRDMDLISILRKYYS